MRRLSRYADGRKCVLDERGKIVWEEPMSETRERPSREECAAQFDVFSNPIYVHAAAYLRQDADLAERLETAESACAIMRERAERCETAEAERDALAEQAKQQAARIAELEKLLPQRPDVPSGRSWERDNSRDPLDVWFGEGSDE